MLARHTLVGITGDVVCYLTARTFSVVRTLHSQTFSALATCIFNLMKIAVNYGVKVCQIDYALH